MKNKVVYMTASVTYAWAGALMQFRKFLGKKFNNVTKGRTDQQTK